MGLLDRFRAQPKWKNADPTARAAAVEELPLDAQDVLVSIARGDVDPTVRLAAVRKVLDPAVLADIAGSDVDASVRDGANDVLVDVATGAYEGIQEAESLAALAGLSDPKCLMAVAKTAALEKVSHAALARLDDAKAIGSVARRSTHASTRLEALGRITDGAELASIALRSDFKDVAVAAVERLTDRAEIEAVAARAKNKAAQRRARGMLRALEEASGTPAAVAPPPTAAPIDAAGRQRLELCRQVEALAASDAWNRMSVRLDSVVAAWDGLGPGGDAEVEQRFESACGAVRAKLARHEAELAERQRVEAQIAVALAARDAICAQVEAIDGDGADQKLQEARAAWVSLAAVPGPAAVRAEAVARRFEAACKASEARHRERVEREGRRARAEQVCRQVEDLAATPRFPDARPRWVQLQKAWASLSAAGAIDDTLAARFSAAHARLQAAETAAEEELLRRQRENLARLEHLCDQLETLARTAELSLKDGERGLREARTALEDPGPLPSRRDHEELARRLRDAHAALVPKVRELREVDEWQRWANAGVQEELCQRAEALREVADPAEAARQLAELQARWKQVATAPREKSQSLWLRFKTAADQVRGRSDQHFAQQAEEWAANLAKKESLCQQAEALADSTDWIRTAEEIKRLQAEWKTTGQVPRGREKATWERFRSACDRFFTRRQQDLARRKEEWAANLVKKEALCVEAEALAESTDWDSAAARIKRLQAEWKAVGPVRRKKSEQVWQRFRAACDRFFERYQQRSHIQASAALAEREQICAELEELVPGAGAEAVSIPPGDLLARARGAWDKWRQLDARGGVARAHRDQLEDRLSNALLRLTDRFPSVLGGTDLDPETNRRKMEELCARVECLSPGAGPESEPDAAPAALLARQLKEALATNTMAGRPAPDAGARWRQLGDEVRKAQAAWKRLGPAPPGIAASLTERFQKACSRVVGRG
jgi:Domain of Unknown Function (DUF349)